MAMSPHSILVGKSHRTPDNEILTVRSIDQGKVVYRAAAGATPAMIARVADQTLSLADFAADVEGEVSEGV